MTFILYISYVLVFNKSSEKFGICNVVYNIENVVQFTLAKFFIFARSLEPRLYKSYNYVISDCGLLKTNESYLLHYIIL